MTIISEFTGSPAIPELGLKTVDLKLEVHSFQTDFRDLQTLDRIFRPVFGFRTRVYRGISCCSAGLRVDTSSTRSARIRMTQIGAGFAGYGTCSEFRNCY